ncbi:hypothetical protein [Palleronia rufa]|uniref:hypothetical protein n=1 Tax=Palleronia rufa TaxID=1530186 RepID=UPI001F25FFD2|nr:hypothetical protein [Palleronia rufa]
MIASNPSWSGRGSGHTRHVDQGRAVVLFRQVELAFRDMQQRDLPLGDAHGASFPAWPPP